jgi:hypothetical protein
VEPIAYHWYQQDSVLGKFKSDFCRLVQIYIHGGVYFDNDFELIQPFPSNVFDMHFTSVTSVDEMTLFQSILISIPQNPIVKDSIMLFQSYMRGELVVDGWLGPTILYRSLYGDDRSLQSKWKNWSVHMLTEKRVEPHLLTHRKYGYACEYGVYADDRFLGYSRSVTFGSDDDTKSSCYFPMSSSHSSHLISSHNMRSSPNSNARSPSPNLDPHAHSPHSHAPPPSSPPLFSFSIL